MKQTAVEWLIEQMMYQMEIRIENTTIGCDLFEQAKEMEKEQIMDAAKIMLEGKIILFNSTEIGDGRAEQYYNETFKQQ